VRPSARPIARVAARAAAINTIRAFRRVRCSVLVERAKSSSHLPIGRPAEHIEARALGDSMGAPLKKRNAMAFEQAFGQSVQTVRHSRCRPSSGKKRKCFLLDAFDALFFMDSPGHVTGTIPSPVTKAISLYWHSPSSP
jgi:hypothetical protein